MRLPPKSNRNNSLQVLNKWLCHVTGVVYVSAPYSQRYWESIQDSKFRPVLLCTDLGLLVQHQTLIQMGQSSVHCFTDSLARWIGLPCFSVCHALIAVGLDSCLNSHEPGRRQLYPATASPHGYCLLNQHTALITGLITLAIRPAYKKGTLIQPKNSLRLGYLTLLVTWPAGLGFTESCREQKSTVLWRPA